MKKLVFILIIALLLCMGVTAYAEESAPDTVFTSAAITTDYITEQESTDEGVMDSELPTDIATEEDSQNLGEWLLGVCQKYATEIIAGITLIAATVSSVIIKKFLKPTIDAWIEKVTKFLSDSEENREQDKKENDALLKKYREEDEKERADLKEKLKQNADSVAQLHETVKGLFEKVVQGGQVNAVLLQCLNDQEETLNTIVQSSTMAQWKKDIAGQRHAAHTAAIADMLSAKNKPTDDPEFTEGGESA